MDHNFTTKIKAWLDTPAQQRDYADGAVMLLQLSGNKILYSNIAANLDAHRQTLEYNLQKYYNFRVRALTHDKVTEMQKQVDTIVAEHLSISENARKAPKGKRADHDALPDDIKALFVENLSILRKMRELHLKLRSLSLEDATCPDSERFPFIAEIIKLDKKMHDNYRIYDTYSPAG